MKKKINLEPKSYLHSQIKLKNLFGSVHMNILQ